MQFIPRRGRPADQRNRFVQHGQIAPLDLRQEIAVRIGGMVELAAQQPSGLDPALPTLVLHPVFQTSGKRQGPGTIVQVGEAVMQVHASLPCRPASCTNKVGKHSRAPANNGPKTRRLLTLCPDQTRSDKAVAMVRLPKPLNAVFVTVE